MDSNVQINNHRRNRISRQHSPLSAEIPAGKEAVPTKNQRRISLAYNNNNNNNNNNNKNNWKGCSNEPVSHDSQQQQRNDGIGHRLPPDRGLRVLQGRDVNGERHRHGNETNGRNNHPCEAAGREEGESWYEGEDHDDSKGAVGVAAGDRG
jgi:hypothetical protein